VGETDVWLGCGDRLVAKLQPGAAWDVRFAVTLHPAKHMHRAVRLAKSLQLTTGLLFPVVGSLSPGAIQPDLDCYSPLVAANPEQRAAVQNIVAGVAGTAPYVVFGPPGTGKTVTLVEAIKQVWLHHPDSHILATAPSNTAADLLAERLLEDIPGNEMLRLHANSRKRISVPSSIEKVSNFRDDGFTFPCITTLAGYRVIVTTLVTAGRLVSAQFPEAHFQHIFIDEAGQVTVACSATISPCRPPSRRR
jgi:helicase MOV-10